MFDIDNIIPLDKLITRLMTDLKLADSSGNLHSSKNQKKSSALFYLMELKALREVTSKRQ